MRRIATRLLWIATLLAFTGCGSRDASGPSPTAPSPTGTSAPVPESIPTDLSEGTRGHDVVAGKIVVKLRFDADLDEFNLVWGTTTEILVEGTLYAQLDLPGEDASPYDYTAAMQGWDGCDVAEPLYHMDSPESRQGTIPFFESSATSDTVIDQSAMDRIGVAAAHALATGAGVIVAIVDTGVDSTHPDLASHMAPDGWDFVDGDDLPMDARAGLDADGDGMPDEAAGHGTHVAGLVHAVAPDAALMAVRVLDSEGVGTSVGVARGIRWAAAHGADVINLSLGMYADAYVIKEAIQDVVGDTGSVVIAAAGNAGMDDRRHFPSRLSRVISVASTDADDLKATFSNYGPRILVSAPGVGLISPWLDHGYASWSGTSMSAPLVSGAAALRLQLFPGTTPADMADAIDATVAPLPEGYAWSGRMGGLLQLGPLLTY